MSDLMESSKRDPGQPWYLGIPREYRETTNLLNEPLPTLKPGYWNDYNPEYRLTDADIRWAKAQLISAGNARYAAAIARDLYVARDDALYDAVLAGAERLDLTIDTGPPIGPRVVRTIYLPRMTRTHWPVVSSNA